MKAKSIFAFALICFALVGCEATKQTQKTGVVGHTANMQGCNSLNADEQAFAAKLRPYNQSVFCEQMSLSQRKEAMTLGKHGNYQYGRGRFYTPDAAVEKVTDQRKEVGRSYRRSCRS